MIEGTVEDGIPLIALKLGGRFLSMIVDSGFNGDLELPEHVRDVADPQFLTRTRSLLAGGQSIEEDLFLVGIEFDGRFVQAEATFADGDVGLIGTRLMRDHRLVIDFVDRTLQIERVEER